MSRKRPYADVETRKAAKERDNYVCQICGSRDHPEGHHIFEYASDGGASNSENIITLCKKCHRKVHEGKIDLFAF